MNDSPKYFFYGIYIYLHTGTNVRVIRHSESDRKEIVRNHYEEEARRFYKENFNYLDIWTLDERMTGVEEYKKEKGLI